MKQQIALLKLSMYPHKRRIMELVYQMPNLDVHLAPHPGIEYDVEIIDRPASERHSSRRIVLNAFQDEPDAHLETNTLTINPLSFIIALENMVETKNTEPEVQA